MGTLFDQLPRDYQRVNGDTIAEEVMWIKQLAGKAGLSVDQVIKLMELLEYKRRTDLMITDRDAWDEQIAGIGELIKDMSRALERLGESVIGD